MSNQFRANQSQMQDYMLKLETLVVRVKVEGNATPASKVLETNAPGVAYIYAEGLTAAADAIEDIDSQVSETPADATGKYSVLIDDEDCKELIHVLAICPGSDTVAITGQKLTTEGRPLVALDSNQDLSGSNDSEVILTLYYLKN